MKQQQSYSLVSYLLIIAVITAVTDTYNGAWQLLAFTFAP